MTMTTHELDVMFAQMNNLPVPGAALLEPLTPTLGLFAEPVPVATPQWGVPTRSAQLSEREYDDLFARVNGIAS
jgi:hypothetical protein